MPSRTSTKIQKRLQNFGVMHPITPGTLSRTSPTRPWGFGGPWWEVSGTARFLTRFCQAIGLIMDRDDLRGQSRDMTA